MMKKIVFIFLLLFMSINCYAQDWSILDEDMSDISDWNDSDSVNGESTQVTFDSQSCMKLDTNTAAKNNAASRQRQGSVIPDNFTVEIKLYSDVLGNILNNDGFVLAVDNGIITLAVYFSDDGLYIMKAEYGRTEVGTDILSEDTWEVLRFVVTGGNVNTATCDVYLDNTLVGDDIDCNILLLDQDGYLMLQQAGGTTNDVIAYIDYLKIDDGLWVPTSEEVAPPKLTITNGIKITGGLTIE